MPHKSAFTKSARSSSEVVHLDPVKRQFLTLTTVGLNRLFNKIQNGEDNVIHGRTDGRGRYCPVIGEVLADKYKITNSLSTQGQSAIIVKAKDLNLEGVDVIIKILHINYYKIGIQESHLLSRLKSADPYLVSHTVKLNTTFKHDRHYCMVFEALNPEPITTVFTSKSWDVRTRLSEIRKLTGKLLQVLSFLKQQNTIHADLKPDNILLKNSDVRSVRVIDFGNAIHHVHQEVSMYYEKFEIQTLLYRAPEVLFGIPFGTEIDMWSLGCILAELFLGKPLFMGLNKQDLLCQISEILGRFPAVIFQRGKFYQDLSQFTGDNTQNDATLMILSQLPGCYDYMFANFLAELLKFDPDKRLCPLEALQHPFMAAEFNMGVTLQAQSSKYSIFPLKPEYYKEKPMVSKEIRRQNPSTYDILRMGTSPDHQAIQNIAVVCPVTNLQQNSQNHHETSTISRPQNVITENTGGDNDLEITVSRTASNNRSRSGHNLQCEADKIGALPSCLNSQRNIYPNSRTKQVQIVPIKQINNVKFEKGTCHRKYSSNQTDIPDVSSMYDAPRFVCKNNSISHPKHPRKHLSDSISSEFTSKHPKLDVNCSPIKTGRMFNKLPSFNKSETVVNKEIQMSEKKPSIRINKASRNDSRKSSRRFLRDLDSCDSSQEDVIMTNETNDMEFSIKSTNVILQEDCGRSPNCRHDQNVSLSSSDVEYLSEEEETNIDGIMIKTTVSSNTAKNYDTLDSTETPSSLTSHSLTQYQHKLHQQNPYQHNPSQHTSYQHDSHQNKSCQHNPQKHSQHQHQLYSYQHDSHHLDLHQHNSNSPHQHNSNSPHQHNSNSPHQHNQHLHGSHEHNPSQNQHPQEQSFKNKSVRNYGGKDSLEPDGTNVLVEKQEDFENIYSSLVKVKAKKTSSRKPSKNPKVYCFSKYLKYPQQMVQDPSSVEDQTDSSCDEECHHLNSGNHIQARSLQQSSKYSRSNKHAKFCKSKKLERSSLATPENYQNSKSIQLVPLKREKPSYTPSVPLGLFSSSSGESEVENISKTVAWINRQTEESLNSKTCRVVKNQRGHGTDQEYVTSEYTDICNAKSQRGGHSDNSFFENQKMQISNTSACLKLVPLPKSMQTSSSRRKHGTVSMHTASSDHQISQNPNFTINKCLRHQTRSKLSDNEFDIVETVTSNIVDSSNKIHKSTDPFRNELVMSNNSSTKSTTGRINMSSPENINSICYKSKFLDKLQTDNMTTIMRSCDKEELPIHNNVVPRTINPQSNLDQSGFVKEGKRRQHSSGRVGLINHSRSRTPVRKLKIAFQQQPIELTSSSKQYSGDLKLDVEYSDSNMYKHSRSCNSEFNDRLNRNPDRNDEHENKLINNLNEIMTKSDCKSYIDSQKTETRIFENTNMVEHHADLISIKEKTQQRNSSQTELKHVSGSWDRFVNKTQDTTDAKLEQFDPLQKSRTMQSKGENIRLSMTQDTSSKERTARYRQIPSQETSTHSHALQSKGERIPSSNLKICESKLEDIRHSKPNLQFRKQNTQSQLHPSNMDPAFEEFDSEQGEVEHQTEDHQFHDPPDIDRYKQHSKRKLNNLSTNKNEPNVSDPIPRRPLSKRKKKNFSNLSDPNYALYGECVYNTKKLYNNT